jgi:HEPN domain-containing protein
MVSAPQTNGLPEGEDRLQSMYFERALNYHIAARYAVVARLAPVSGNLAHHAIEFYLKGALIKELDQAARRKMSHKLLKLWRRYNAEGRIPHWTNLIKRSVTSTNLSAYGIPRKY